MRGVALALSWLTVLPIRGPGHIDRSAAGAAIAAAPVAGLVLGLGTAGALWAAVAAGCTPLLAGLIGVGFLGLATRGMHLDGLCDTADGLGCYGPPERAREVMKSGGAGPFGAATLVLVLGAQAASFGALADVRSWFAVVLAVTAGRVAVVLACRRGVAAAQGSGFGALVAGTQPLGVGVLWAVVAVVAAAWCVPGAWWAGPATVAVGLVAALLLVRHCVRRFGGLNGDALGAGLETTVTVVAAALSAAVG
ncbi:adenosylcobinamide-GDP ribazoletransferase [Rhodococcus ruber]|uniref:adenosylcobinamide-GDP ribazoletransferase n=1 Tax=Rhodococcus ruber TaxID=1830 RepID=UPI00265E4122|nr:adenosylcobinamide-GDP ribazoletransferase [Rhodococcus ruber]MDO1480261.1 adenosylcobinamide-GDP ribazoletransferase [Rhodococcus ruber]